VAERAILILDMPIQAKQLVREKIDLGLAALAMDWQLSVVFIGEGVWQLLKPQFGQVDRKGKDYCAALGLFEMYGADGLYAVSGDLAERGLSLNNLRLPVQAVSTDALRGILNTADHLL